MKKKDEYLKYDDLKRNLNDEETTYTFEFTWDFVFPDEFNYEDIKNDNYDEWIKEYNDNYESYATLINYGGGEATFKLEDVKMKTLYRFLQDYFFEKEEDIKMALDDPSAVEIIEIKK